MTEKQKSKIREELQEDLKVVQDFIPKLIEFLKKNKKRLIIIGAVLAVIGAIGTYEMIHLTSEPEFCNLFCHEMTPEVEAWEQSRHAQRGIDCKECHYGPGIKGVILAKYYAQFQLLHHITGSYADHPLEEAKEKGYFLDEQHIHRKGNKTYYIKAHGYPLDVINFNCKRCHQNYKKIKRSSGRSVRMEHEMHINKGYECTDCHYNIVHGTDPKGLNLPTMWTCFQCHDDSGEEGKAPREECTLCHVGQKDMWEGIGAKNVDDESAMMLGEVECIDCHLKEEKYQPPRGGGACVECHEDEEYAATLKEWQTEVKKKSFTLRTILNELAERINTISEPDRKGAKFKQIEELYNDASHNATMIEQDGSKGAHNFDYASSILDTSLKMARDARGILREEE
jgi:nitrate/TMAO reductase-like tetraheme cytochrome c subunit